MHVREEDLVNILSLGGNITCCSGHFKVEIRKQEMGNTLWLFLACKLSGRRLTKSLVQYLPPLSELIYTPLVNCWLLWTLKAFDAKFYMHAPRNPIIWRQHTLGRHMWDVVCWLCANQDQQVLSTISRARGMPNMHCGISMNELCLIICLWFYSLSVWSCTNELHSLGRF